MENRLCLNKKPKYELPKDVLLGQYTRFNKKEDITPDFIPDICMCNWGQGNIGKIRGIKQDARQIWVKTDNMDLLYFINNLKWKDYIKNIGSPFIGISLFKKIILEEFYGVKNGE